VQDLESLTGRLIIMDAFSAMLDAMLLSTPKAPLESAKSSKSLQSLGSMSLRPATITLFGNGEL
jgi:hypothetical protein